MLDKKIGTVFIGDIAFNRDVTPEKDQTSIGGAAYYCAVGAMSALRQESITSSNIGIVSPVGGDFNLKYLLDKKINTDGVSVVSNGKTCRFILTQHPDNTREFSAERNVAEKVRTEILPTVYLKAHYVHLATSLPQNYQIWIDFLRKTNSDIIVSTDAFEAFAQDFPELSIAALNMSDFIFINDTEADILSRKGSLRTDVPWVLKHGARGATYINGKTSIDVPAPKLHAVETTGAGDVLAGAFLTLLTQGFDPKRALTTAVYIASQSVTQFGVEHLVS